MELLAALARSPMSRGQCPGSWHLWRAAGAALAACPWMELLALTGTVTLPAAPLAGNHRITEEEILLLSAIPPSCLVSDFSNRPPGLCGSEPAV